MRLSFLLRDDLLCQSLVFLGFLGASCDGSKLPGATTGSSWVEDVCESRTINYITHTLPQQCLRTSWPGPTPVAAGEDGRAADPSATTADAAAATTPENSKTRRAPSEPTAEQPIKVGLQGETPEQGQESVDGAQDRAQVQDQDLATGSFMSFEEWKEMMLRKSGQDPADIKGMKGGSRRRDRRTDRGAGPSNVDFDSMGDEGEISLDFDALSEKVSELTGGGRGSGTDGGATAATPTAATTAASHARQADAREEPVLYDDGKTQYYRSRDAGKTCKERFSYASFDAGATVLKTSPGAQNAKAILVENKDSYMLLECAARDKFVIVELSDDVLVDTVVLANFEFFSSMIRRFRVSVSDRYPVKADKWLDLGTFEARNSRDIQPFLVEHPQIYTKYVRVDFLSHYGSEYYCPVSLLRVHGTRMLDSWKESEAGSEDETDEGAAEVDRPIGDDEDDGVVEDNEDEERQQQQKQEQEQQQEPQDVAGQPPNSSPDGKNASPSALGHEALGPGDPTSQDNVGLSYWRPVFYQDWAQSTCMMRSPTTAEPTPVSLGGNYSMPSPGQDAAAAVTVVRDTPSAPPSDDEASQTTTIPQSSLTSQLASSPSPPSSYHTDATKTSSPSTVTTPSASNPAGAKRDTADTSHPPPSASLSAASNASAPPSSTTTSLPPPQPTVQESFFKTVTKRLQHLESNTSLSLQYIEEQSRFLQEALRTMERRQIARVDAFLDGLNRTVLGDLHSVRAQYDQLWQGTVLALEAQRDRADRELAVLTGRLTILADEVVFQRRMAILQSVMLLACLALVVFSRGGSVLDLALHAHGYGYGGGSGGSSVRRHSLLGGSASAPTMTAFPPPTISPAESGGAEYADHPHHLHLHHYQNHDDLGSMRRYPTLRPDGVPSYQDKVLPLTPPAEHHDQDQEDHDRAYDSGPEIGGATVISPSVPAAPPLIHIDDVDARQQQQQQQLAEQETRTEMDTVTPLEETYNSDSILVAGDMPHPKDTSSSRLSARRHEQFIGAVADNDESEYEADPEHRPLSRHSSMSQPRSFIKPLPALPEDPS